MTRPQQLTRQLTVEVYQTQPQLLSAGTAQPLAVAVFSLLGEGGAAIANATAAVLRPQPRPAACGGSINGGFFNEAGSATASANATNGPATASATGGGSEGLAGAATATANTMNGGPASAKATGGDGYPQTSGGAATANASALNGGSAFATATGGGASVISHASCQVSADRLSQPEIRRRWRAALQTQMQ